MKKEPLRLRTPYRPQAAALEVTLRCDMSCIHCGSSATRKDAPDPLSYEEWCSVVDDLKRLEVKRITLSGGEPFLYPRWRDLVRHIKDDKTGVNFISNGYNITEDDVRFMKEAGVEHVGVSLDGDEPTHDYIRRKPGSFKKVVELLRMGREHGLPVFPATSINKVNFGVREKMLRVVLENGVKAWQVQVVNSFGRAGKMRDTMLIDPAQYVTLCDDILRWQKESAGKLRIMPADSLGYCHPVTDALLSDYEWQGCNAGLYVIGIRADGTVLGCLSLQDASFSAGSVRRRPLTEIWDDDDAFAYTRKSDPSKLTGACRSCPSGPVCKAGCPGMAFSIGGTIHENPYCYRAIVEARNAPSRG